MSRIFRMCISVLLLALLFFPSNLVADASRESSAAKVKVELPKFQVRLNGEKMENAYSQYPLITYNGITYFPMTYHNCRFLGLETEWKTGEPLKIQKSEISASYFAYTQKKRNPQTATAIVSTDPVSINGKTIAYDSLDKYPLLRFRNIRYFPLTWEYAVNHFGWKYNYTSANGLTIDSDNKKITPLLKIDTDAISYSDGYVYYSGKKGTIMRAPLNKIKSAMKVFQLPVNFYNNDYENPSLSLDPDDKKVYLRFRAGGGVMGHNEKYYFDEKGKTVDLTETIDHIKMDEHTTVKRVQYFPPIEGNLYVKTVGDEDFRQIGNKDYHYGSKRSLNRPQSTSGGGSQFNNPNNLALFGDWLYATGHLGTPKDGLVTPQTVTSIYKINIKTNETVLVGEFAYKFKRDGDFIYYTAPDGAHKISLADGVKSKWEEAGDATSLGVYEVFGGKLYAEETLGKTPCYTKKWTDGDKQYLIVTFQKDRVIGGLTIFDISGNAVFKTDEEVDIDSVTIEKGLLYYYSKSTKTFCQVRL